MSVASCVAGLLGQAKRGVSSFVPLIILVLYTVLGALVFVWLEAEHERQQLAELAKQREKLLDDAIYRLNVIKSLPPVAAYNHTRKTLERFRDENGVGPVDPNDVKWTFWGGLFYSLTVYTTIGYGNIVVETGWGRLATVIYALIGFPLAVICLVGLGSLFARGASFLWRLLVRSTGLCSKRLERKVAELGPDEQIAERASSNGGTNDDDLLNFPTTFLILITVLWIFICAGLFMLWEKDWTYGTSLYFVFISFMTIGFGDVLPSEPDHIILIGWCLLIGLSLVSTAMTIIQQQIGALADNMKANIDKEYMNALAEAAWDGDEDAQAAHAAATALSDEETAENGNQDGKKISTGQRAVAEQQLDERSMDAVVSRMPWSSRVLYRIMSERNRKQLNEHASRRQGIRTFGTQTTPPEYHSIATNFDDPTDYDGGSTTSLPRRVRILRTTPQNNGGSSQSSREIDDY